jgi:CDGSH iron-sulfur domain-containing protein 3
MPDQKGAIAQKAPYPIDVVAGQTYYWCACGKSKSQPFCDGSHKGSQFTPQAYVADKSGTVYFCGCKQSGRAALCDGTHKSL